MMRKKIYTHRNSGFGEFFLLNVAVAGFFTAAFFGLPDVLPISYESAMLGSLGDVGASAHTQEAREELPLRLPTPKPLKAVYMTQCVAGTPSFRADVIRLIEDTELNAVVIDVKDFSGRLGFRPHDPSLKEAVSETCYAPDMKEFLRTLKEKGIYTIARITVFQDPYLAHKRPYLAVQKASDKTIWEDYKGLSFIDAGAEEMWAYTVAIGKEAYDIGFDELNFDYVRFPSDGNMSDVYFPHSNAHLIAEPISGKSDIIENFFAYLHEHLDPYKKDQSAGTFEPGPVLSVDLFGMVTTHTQDLNIGQILERALPYFDYVAPMVYPSHYPRGFNGWQNPNEHVYDVVKFAMISGVERAVATTTMVKTNDNTLLSTSTTPYTYSKETYSKYALRPWLQDFDYGGNYGTSEVRAQIQATYDAGLDSWTLWDPANRYTREALEPFYTDLHQATTEGE